MKTKFNMLDKSKLKISGFYIDNPQKYKGKWKNIYKTENPFHLELGCGKGKFISNIALKNKNINYLAIDQDEEKIELAKSRISKFFVENKEEISNLYIIKFNIEKIYQILNKKDKVERIYINYCNPLPKEKSHKKRLTHTRQLKKYRKILIDNGEIYFKTDDDGLFNDSLIYFEESGFEIVKKTLDLHSEVDFWDNIETEHEKKFSKEGYKTKAIIARKL